MNTIKNSRAAAGKTGPSTGGNGENGGVCTRPPSTRGNGGSRKFNQKERRDHIDGRGTGRKAWAARECLRTATTGTKAAMCTDWAVEDSWADFLVYVAALETTAVRSKVLAHGHHKDREQGEFNHREHKDRIDRREKGIKTVDGFGVLEKGFADGHCGVKEWQAVAWRTGLVLWAPKAKRLLSPYPLLHQKRGGRCLRTATGVDLERWVKIMRLEAAWAFGCAGAMDLVDSMDMVDVLVARDLKDGKDQRDQEHFHKCCSDVAAVFLAWDCVSARSQAAAGMLPRQNCAPRPKILAPHRHIISVNALRLRLDRDQRVVGGAGCCWKQGERVWAIGTKGHENARVGTKRHKISGVFVFFERAEMGMPASRLIGLKRVARKRINPA
ncbi:MAG: hypothetical protein JWR26_425 [Pedosphaera sp.]|nr:hypothetical protein [Pedosphaera sp.]